MGMFDDVKVTVNDGGQIIVFDEGQSKDLVCELNAYQIENGKLWLTYEYDKNGHHYYKTGDKLVTYTGELDVYQDFSKRTRPIDIAPSAHYSDWKEYRFSMFKGQVKEITCLCNKDGSTMFK
jgi:hypothetical protein